MSETETPWQVRSHLILYRAADSAVFLQATDLGWSLPRADLTERVWIRPDSALNQWVKEQLGIPAITLYCASLAVDREKQAEETIFVMEVRGEREIALENGRFFTLHDLATLSLAQPEHHALLEKCLHELAGNPPVFRPPWLCPGWLDEAAVWMMTELNRLGYVVAGAVEQVSNWPLSAVLRVTTTAGNVYFKAVVDMPLFVNEPTMVKELARLSPGNLPEPLAIEPAKRWILMSDFGTAVGRKSPLETQAEMVRQFGRIQARLASCVEELVQIGCLDRRLERLAVQLDELLADEKALEGLETAEMDKLRQSAPRLKAIMSELTAYRVPQTLMHGDLHLDNVALRDGQMLFFDWTDACITHPFMDMMVIYEEPDEANRIYLRDEYLQQWTAFEPMEQLLDVWKKVEFLWPLHQAISYQYIVANLEEVPRQGFGKVIIHYLREVLKSLNNANPPPNN